MILPHRAKGLLSLEEREKIEEFSKRGLNYRQIAEKLGRSLEGVRKEFLKYSRNKPYSARDAHALARGKGSWISLSLEDRILIEKMIRENKSIPEIALKLGRTTNSISKELLINTGENGYEGKEAHRISRERRMSSARIGAEKHKKRFSAASAAEEKIQSLEMQLEIILDQLKELKCQKS